LGARSEITAAPLSPEQADISILPAPQQQAIVEPSAQEAKEEVTSEASKKAVPEKAKKLKPSVKAVQDEMACASALFATPESSQAESASASQEMKVPEKVSPRKQKQNISFPSETSSSSANASSNAKTFGLTKEEALALRPTRQAPIPYALPETEADWNNAIARYHSLRPLPPDEEDPQGKVRANAEALAQSLTAERKKYKLPSYEPSSGPKAKKAHK
jgi:hypothetical protein